MSPLSPQSSELLVGAMSSSPIRQVSSRCTRRLATSFGIASLIAVASGCLVASSGGASRRIWGPSAAAWVLGAGLAWLTARVPPVLFLRAVVLLGIVSVLLSLFDPGVAGVHRWVALGPLRWNVAFLWLPAVSVALAAAARSGLRWAWWAALMIQAALWFQPDASQATAVAASIISTLLITQPCWRARLGVSLLFALIAASTWTRPDPLAPVPEVEGILQMAVAHSRGVATVSVVSLIAAAASPLMALSSAQPLAYPSGVALSVYFLVCAVMPFFGAFPVPLTGMGMSPIVGFWLGIGALTAVCDSATHDSAPGGLRHSNESRG
ncbi:MAG: hypothetical protein H7039_24965 [Bryobacteraceae bacterium]|nr:hypothetical protein [Bryobacteraceae bacterium]